MKKLIYLLAVPLVVASGLVFANREPAHEAAETSMKQPIALADTRTAREQWEASPDGIKYMEWKASPKGRKVLGDAARIRQQVDSFTNMEAVVTSLTLPPGSRLGFGVMARINGIDYILCFGPKLWNEYQQLRSLRVNDKIIIRSRSVSHAPRYAYPILSGDYVERDGKIIYIRIPKGGC